jgi:hypothetical protein
MATRQSWRDGRLCEDLPGLGVALVERSSAELMSRGNKEIQAIEKTVDQLDGA